jgi:16S rRNA (guanine966-N2)-methyltransferase
LRVAGGRLAGRPIAAPSGRSTRPTGALVRSALFDALEGRWGERPGPVLDLFAGSGALGVEALSRGCPECTFVERDPSALRVLRGNIRSLGLGAVARVLAMDAWRVLGPAGVPDGARMRLVLADPPYRDGGTPVLAALARARWLAPDALCALEHASREEMPERSGTLELVWRRAYGDSALSVYADRREPRGETGFAGGPRAGDL